MPELTVLDEKLAEVLGLAQAAQAATKKVGQLAKKDKDTPLVKLMDRMNADAVRLEQRCQKVADKREGLTTKIKTKARETKAEVADFMTTYLADGDALDGLEFMSMAEAGELGHWEIVAKLNVKAKDADIAKLVDVAVPMQRKHADAVRKHALRLAAEEDPSEEA